MYTVYDLESLKYNNKTAEIFKKAQRIFCSYCNMKNILAFGNPLLDTIVSIHDDKLLKKYNLTSNGQREISREEMISLSQDIEGCEKTVTAGGCSQNTLKVIQWLVHKQWSTTIFGSIGDDDDGETLKQLLNNSGVQTQYVTRSDQHTGTTVALINGVNSENRSLVACLGAAEVIFIEDVSDNIIDKIKDADLVYIEGFFLTKRLETAIHILRQCKKLFKRVAFNFCGEYLCREHHETIKYFFKNCDIILGNRKEFEAFLGHNDVEHMLMTFTKRNKIIVMSDGPKAVVGVNGVDKMYEFEVPTLTKNDVIDTTGAGDSFAAGFCVGYLLEKPFEVCLELGCYAAREIIKIKGCALPDHSPSFAL